jgi:hypothetical protein
MSNKPNILWIGFCGIFSVWFIWRSLFLETNVFRIGEFVIGAMLFWFGSEEFNKFALHAEGELS